MSSADKGKEVVQARMQISDNDRLDSIETNDELPIQFGSIPRDFFGEYGIYVTGNV